MVMIYCDVGNNVKTKYGLYFCWSENAVVVAVHIAKEFACSLCRRPFAFEAHQRTSLTAVKAKTREHILQVADFGEFCTISCVFILKLERKTLPS